MMRAAAAAFLLVFACAALAQTPAERRAEVRKMRAETLAKLYKIHPAAKGKIGSAYGYAVFSNAGVNLIFASIAAGRGIAHDNKANRDIFMKMGSAGVGLGLGVKDFRGIFIFKTKKAFDTFVNEGWEGGAHADAIAVLVTVDTAAARDDAADDLVAGDDRILREAPVVAQDVQIAVTEAATLDLDLDLALAERTERDLRPLRRADRAVRDPRSGHPSSPSRSVSECALRPPRGTLACATGCSIST